MKQIIWVVWAPDEFFVYKTRLEAIKNWPCFSNNRSHFLYKLYKINLKTNTKR